eukprot:8851595-Pyramimonas_sp.AAC.1
MLGPTCTQARSHSGSIIRAEIAVRLASCEDVLSDALDSAPQRPSQNRQRVGRSPPSRSDCGGVSGGARVRLLGLLCVQAGQIGDVPSDSLSFSFPTGGGARGWSTRCVSAPRVARPPPVPPPLL